MTDSEPSTAAQKRIAAALYRQLSNRKDECAVLNDPSRIVGRYDLLKHLCNIGSNDFNVHRALSLPIDVRFPAFVRYEDRHIGPLTDPFQTRSELDDALERLEREGHPLERLLIVEYLDTSVDGVFTKFGAQKVGQRVFGKHVMAGQHWMLKRRSSDRKFVAAREVAYVSELPHRDQLERVYDCSGHEWGRLDYSVHKGRVQVWEINDNPELGTKWKGDFGRRPVNVTVMRNTLSALEELAAHITPGLPMEFRLSVDAMLG